MIRRLNKCILAIFLLWSVGSSAHALEHPNHNIGFYIKNFGGCIDPETLPNVYDVFTKVRSVAEVNHRDSPELFIIKDLPGPPAFVLPDGNLILTQQALDVVYKDVLDQEEGDTRLAFVLGHELAHLASDDYWSSEVKHLIQSKALSGEINDSILEQIERDYDDVKESEFKADDKGFLYAAMAGFPVEILLDHENDFLSYWVAQTYTQSSKTHPEATERTELLRIRLQQAKDALEFFYMGVRLAHFGRYQDAIYFFREFQKVFPGREVFNNLGVCYLQMAVKKMPPSFAYHYWLPCILDNKTVIDRLNVSPIFRDRTQIEIAKDFLEQSANYLETAIKKDPAYRIGYINLAVAYFYLDEIYKARAAIEDVRERIPRLQSDDYEVESLRALIISKDLQRSDNWSDAKKIFSDLANDHPSDALPPSFYYNWARLLEDRGRSAEMQWQELTKQIDKLPRPIARILCERLEDPSAIEECLEAINESDTKNRPTFPKPLPIQPGSDAWQSEQAEHPLHNWRKLTLSWPGKNISAEIYRDSQSNVALAMDGIVEMVILRKNLGPLKQFLQENGPPQHKQEILNGELWSYGHWCVFIEQDRIKEFWVVRKPL